MNYKLTNTGISMIKIGCVGGGFIGTVCYKAFSQLSKNKYEIALYDIDPIHCRANQELDNVNFTSLDEVAKCDVIFVALPTPMEKNTGKCHINIVAKAIVELRDRNKDSCIVLKSTVPPGTVAKFNFNYGKIFFSPEFLTEANAYNDFKDLPYQIIGTNKDDSKEDIDLIKNIFFDCYKEKILACQKIYEVDSTMAEMVKYTRNCYLATRLSFFQEIKKACDLFEVDFVEMKFLAGLDERVGNHYNTVNNKWGGHCLIKDINALMYELNKRNEKPIILGATCERNNTMPEDKEWEKLEGRAFINNKKNDKNA